MKSKKNNLKRKLIISLEFILNFITIAISLFLIYLIKMYINNYPTNISLIELLTNVIEYIALPKVMNTNLIYIFVTMSLILLYEASVFRKQFINAYLSLILSLFLGFSVLVIINYVFSIDIIGPITFAALLIIETTFFSILFLVEHRFFLKLLNIKVLLIGTDKDLNKYFLKFLKSLPIGRELKYVYQYEEETEAILNNKLLNILSDIEMIYILPSISNESKDKIIKYAAGKMNISIGIIPYIYEVGLMKTQFEMVDDVMVSKIQPFQFSLFKRILKRTIDLFFSCIAFLILLPLYLIISLAIKFQDGGPILFKQLRMTRGGKKFFIYKFRSMIVNAEKDTGAIQAREDDDRITKIGKFLRRTRLDEIPQLINVIFGQMSIVGPRSLRVEEVDEYSKLNPDFEFRLNVKAGITGMAQIYGNYITKPDDKLRLDLYYIRHFNFMLDLRLLLLTLNVLFDKNSSKGILNDEVFDKVEFDKYLVK